MATELDAINRVLTVAAPAVKETALCALEDANPQWRGAHLADFLSELSNVDASCGEIEALFDEHGGHIAGVGTEFLSPAYYVLRWGLRREPTWTEVRELIEAAAR